MTGRASPDPLSISVIIPTLDEGSGLARALESSRGRGVEQLVVDGGSRDDTRERARRLGADRVLDAPRGRGAQLAAGLAAAQGEVVLFLHADTLLETGWLDALRASFTDPSVAGGAFRLRFESSRTIYRLLEWGVRLRTAVGGLPYGDQALFVRRALLQANGGVPEVPIFEDLDLARLTRRLGRAVLLRPAAITSPRRYETHGVWRVILRNQLALAAYLIDLDRGRVARWYRGSL